MSEIELRVQAMANEDQLIIASLAERCRQLAVALALSNAKVAQLEAQAKRADE